MGVKWTRECISRFPVVRTLQVSQTTLPENGCHSCLLIRSYDVFPENVLISEEFCKIFVVTILVLYVEVEEFETASRESIG